MVTLQQFLRFRVGAHCCFEESLQTNISTCDYKEKMSCKALAVSILALPSNCISLYEEIKLNLKLSYNAKNMEIHVLNNKNSIFNIQSSMPVLLNRGVPAPPRANANMQGG